MFQNLVPAASKTDFTAEKVSSGITELDKMFHGGLIRGSVTLITGPSGVGKTTCGLLFLKEAASRGEPSILYTFEENAEKILYRNQAINLPLTLLLDRKALTITQIEPVQFSPYEFADLLRTDVIEKNLKFVLIDSSAGFQLFFRHRHEALVEHLHTVTKYISNLGVTVLIVNEVKTITGDFQVSEIGISYLADNIIFMRYLERAGEIRRVIGVLKMRLGNFEKQMCEFEISNDGINVGKPLTGLRSILSGTPE